MTPVQLVSMVSTIANGGTYLPPHMLMNTADSTNDNLRPQPFHPDGELPKTLPEGSHRVISPLASAQMRKMMEGIVLYGTGRNARAEWLFGCRQNRHGPEDRSRDTHLFKDKSLSRPSPVLHPSIIRSLVSPSSLILRKASIMAHMSRHRYSLKSRRRRLSILVSHTTYSASRRAPSTMLRRRARKTMGPRKR